MALPDETSDLVNQYKRAASKARILGLLFFVAVFVLFIVDWGSGFTLPPTFLESTEVDYTTGFGLAAWGALIFGLLVHRTGIQGIKSQLDSLLIRESTKHTLSGSTTITEFESFGDPELERVVRRYIRVRRAFLPAYVLSLASLLVAGAVVMKIFP